MITLTTLNRTDSVLLAICDTDADRAHVRTFAACVAICTPHKRDVRVALKFQSRHEETLRSALRYLRRCVHDWNAAGDGVTSGGDQC